MDIGAFFSALFADWVGWMTGVVSICLAVFGLYRPKANQKRAFLTAAFVCYLIAPVHIWSTEHQLRLQADDARTPGLHPQIDEVLTGQVEEPSPLAGQTYLVIVMSIRNTGAPSVAEDYQVSVNIPGKPAISAIRYNLAIDSSSPAGEQKFSLQDEIDRKTAAPVDRGGMDRGYLLCIVPGVDKPTLDTFGTSITVSFVDIEGTRYSTSITQKNGTGDSIITFPGMQTK